MYAQQSTSTTSIPELDENSSRALPDDHISKLTLRPHQQALLYRCLSIERDNIEVPGTMGTQYIRSRMGVIGDRPGSGKSFVTLALLCSDLLNDEPGVRSFGNGKVIRYTKLGAHDSVHTDMVVVPHSLARQWETYVRDYTRLTCAVITKAKQVEGVKWSASDLDASYDLLLVSNSMYAKVAEHLAINRIHLRRVVFDEIDSINFPQGSNSRCVQAQFYWFVSASYLNMIHPMTDAVVLRRPAVSISVSDSDRVPALANPAFTLTSSQSRSYVRPSFATSLFYELFGDISTLSTMRLLVAKNQDSFVEESMALPPLETVRVECFDPASVRVLNGLVERDVLECLNACDSSAAICRLKNNFRGNEEGVIRMMVAAYDITLSSSRSRLACMPSITYVSDDERRIEEARLTKSCTDAENRITCIRERIKGSGVCNVCYDDLQDSGRSDNNPRCIVPCCSNAFCVRCIEHWTELSKTCPVCKRELDVGTVAIVEEVTRDGYRYGTSSLSPLNGKLANLRHVFRQIARNHPCRSKTLVFTSHDSVFPHIEAMLSEDDISMRCAYLRGNSTTVNSVVDKYKGDGLDVLLANTTSYGSGLNLENTTDIVLFHKTDPERERQVVGRGYRMGRTTPLRVWHLLHSNEVT